MRFENVSHVAPTLPWFRDKVELPGPLPTQVEIENATTEFPSIYGPHVRRTVLVNEHFVVKYGPVVFENEGHALLLVEKYVNIPSPRLFAMYRQDEILYIVMEYIKGHQLSDIWPALADNEKDSIVCQLRVACDSLRSIPSPGTFCGAQGGPMPHRYFFSVQKDPRITGPFTNENDLHHALALHSSKNWASCAQRSWISEFFARHVSRTMQGHKSVFTHADFQRKNILIEEDQGQSQALSSILDLDRRRCFKVTAILDWESAGWYPAYWAYASCFVYFTWDDDWPEKVEKIFEPCVSEATFLKLIAQDLDQ